MFVSELETVAQGKSLSLPDHHHIPDLGFKCWIFRVWIAPLVLMYIYKVLTVHLNAKLWAAEL